MQNKTFARRLAASACALLLPALAGGCGAGNDQDAQLAAMVAAFKAEIPTQAATDSAQPQNEGLRIGSVNMGMNGEWYAEAMNGIWDAAQDLGVTAMMLDSEGSMEKEQENIARLVEDGIDALVISPRDSTDSIAALQPAIDAGIPIITWNTNVNTDVTSFVCVDSIALGGDTGDYLCEYIKTYGLTDIRLIVVDNKNYDVGIARCDGFLASIKDMVDQGVITIVAQEDTDTYEGGIELTTRLLAEHPDANAIWVWMQPALLGTIEALRQAGRQDVLVMGADMSMELAKDMLGDEVNLLAITTQLPYNMGYKSVVAAVDAIHGKPVDQNIYIPLFTYTKNDTELLQRYITAHQGIVEWEGGQWYE